jgi:hypothetical protein
MVMKMGCLSLDGAIDKKFMTSTTKPPSLCFVDGIMGYPNYLAVLTDTLICNRRWFATYD